MGLFIGEKSGDVDGNGTIQEEKDEHVVEHTSELYRKYRPKTFKDVLGQEDAVNTIKSFLKEKRLPHSILFCGPSGTGKTTLARILRVKMQCTERIDFFEINAAEKRGIDDIRDIMNIMTIRPLCSPCRMWLIDECFHPDTLVDTISGRKKISMVGEGELVYNLRGIGKVEKVFRNRIPLHRIIRLKFSNGKVIYSTIDHRFLTSSGWKEARYLDGSDVIYARSKENQNVCDVSKSVHSSTIETESRVLFQKMCWDSQTKKERKRINRRTNLQRVQKSLLSEEKLEEGFLQSVVCCKKQDAKTGNPREALQFGSSEEDFGKSSEVSEDRERSGGLKRVFREDENPQPWIGSQSNRKNESDERKIRNTPYVEREKRRERTTNGSTEKSSGYIRRGREWMGTRSFHHNRIWEEERSDSESYEISSELQSGCRESASENRNRGRWERPQIEKSYIARSQKDRASEQFRLENSQIYQRGYNDELFTDIVGDRERDEGYVVFYDLQISGNPSYFVDGIPVHNCHQLTADGQGALLKALEDAPSHVYFMLATTNPKKLRKEIRTRCTTITLNPLDRTALRGAVMRMVELENRTIDEKVLNKLCDVSDGSGRKAVVDWDRIKGLPTIEAQLSALELGEELEKSAFEMCQLLMNKNSKWEEVAEIISSLREKEGEEPEGLRCMVLKYATTTLLGKGQFFNGMAQHILNNFESSDPWSGIPGWGSLVRAAYAVFLTHRAR